MIDNFWILLVLSAPTILCKELYYNFDISYFDGTPDGVPVRILGINNQFPGPSIRATKFDILNIKVTNHIQDHQPTTIHWHGLEQYLNPFVDGPRMITQCDIPFNGSFVYSFQLLQSGSYWYHSHHTSQMGEGLWGLIIIDNTPEVYNYDGELLIAPSPWYHIPGKLQSEWYMDKEKSQGNLPVPDSTLINGVGYYPCEYARRKNMSCNPSFRERYVQFEVERGKTYRIRYFNPSPISEYMMSIDDHKFTLIETDGVDTMMADPVDTVAVSTGGRDSFLVTMNGDQDQYWIRFKIVPGGLSPSTVSVINPFPEAYFGVTILAVLKYKDPYPKVKTVNNSQGESVMNPLAVQGRPDRRDIHYRDLSDLMLKSTVVYPDFLKLAINLTRNANEQSHVTVNTKSDSRSVSTSMTDPISVSFAIAPFPTTQPADNSVILKYNAAGPVGEEVAPNYVNQTILIDMPDMEDPENHSHRTGFNNITFDTSSLDKPAIFKVLLGETLPPPLNPIVINGFGSDYVVEVIFSDYGKTGHPIHLHGHSFWVMGRGNKNDGPFVDKKHRPCLKSGTRRETISCLPKSWLVVRFRADNPGVWLLHCHISHHFDLAMGLVFVEGVEEAKKIYKFPKESVRLCQMNMIDLEKNPPELVAAGVNLFSTQSWLLFTVVTMLGMYLS